MKLRYSPTSPYVRKVLVSAMELGLAERIERVPANPWDPDDDLPNSNPLGKVPALETDEGELLFDSFVICDYLDSLQAPPQLLPSDGSERRRVLQQHALADGILDAAVLRLIERARRPEALRWPEWADRQKDKIERALKLAEAGSLEAPAGSARLDLAQITLGCALGYLDFRFPDEDWRARYPKLAAWYEAVSARPALRETVPQEA